MINTKNEIKRVIFSIVYEFLLVLGSLFCRETNIAVVQQKKKHFFVSRVVLPHPWLSVGREAQCEMGPD